MWGYSNNDPSTISTTPHPDSVAYKEADEGDHWITVDEADDEHGKRRWQTCARTGRDRKQRWKNGVWITVWVI